MKTKWLSVVCGITLILALGLSTVQAQSGIDRWLYVLTPTTDAYVLLRINIDDNVTEPIFSVARFSTSSFATLMPPEEMNALTDFAKTKYEPFTTLQDWLSLPVATSISSLSVAPDNQNIALNLTYQVCNHNYHFCFGLSQIILISAVTKAVTPLLSRGFHSAHFLPEGCIVSVFTNLIFDDVRWTYDGKALVMSEYGDSCLNPITANTPIIVIPVGDGSKAFVADEAVTWDVSSDSKTISAVVRNCASGQACTGTLDVVQIDLATQKVSKVNYSLGTSAYVDNYHFGVYYFGDTIIFSLYDNNKEDCCGIGLFRLNPTHSLSISPMPMAVSQVSVSPDKQTALFQSVDDGSLSTATIVGNVVQTQHLLDGPIDFWQWGPDKMLLIHRKDDPTYSIMNLQGQTLHTIDIVGLVKKSLASAQVNTGVDAAQSVLVGW